jgi:PAS domain S-box-containing protein
MAIVRPLICSFPRKKIIEMIRLKSGVVPLGAMYLEKPVSLADLLSVVRTLATPVLVSFKLTVRMDPKDRNEIGDHDRTREKLRQTEERYQVLVESIQDYAIYILDPHGFVTSWNSGAQRIKGYSAAEIIGKHFSCFYTPDDIKVNKPKENLEIVTSTGRHEDESLRVRKDGSVFWANVLITAIRAI